MVREPREQFVLDLLDDGWPADTPFGVTPHISYGGYDSDKDTPQVTVGQPEEGPTGGGETGYDGIDGAGGQPHQTIVGLVPVDLWASINDLDSATTSNPREYLTGSADRSTGTVTGGAIEELYDIVEANASRPTNPKTGNVPLDVISHGQAAPVPEPDTRGLYHYLVPINFVYSTA